MRLYILLIPMKFEEKVSEVERLISHHRNIRIDGRENQNRIYLIGTFDDLNPEPERSHVEEQLDEAERKIRFNEELSFDYDSLSTKNSYGQKSLIINLS